MGGGGGRKFPCLIFKCQCHLSLSVIGIHLLPPSKKKGKAPVACHYDVVRPEVSKKFKGLKLLVTVTVNLRIEVEVSKMKSILKLILSLIS